MNSMLFENASVTPRSKIMALRRERLFYTGMAFAIAITVIVGFARTYYLRPYFNQTPLIPLLHLHGAVFTSWLVLFLIQNVLVAANRTSVHRRLGIIGAIIAVLVVVVGSMTAVIRAKQAADSTGGSAPLVFLVIPLCDMLVFGSLIGAAFYFRRRPDVHKRLMLLATISILAAAIARLPFSFLKFGAPAFFGLTDLFIVACFLYDLGSHRRIHPATIWAGLVIVASQPLRLMIGGTHAWLVFATWLTHWVS